jgi:serine/threonine-protein kinase
MLEARDLAMQTADEPKVMSDEFRIRELLEEVLESGRTPDEVCAECPELLPIVRRRLRQIRRVERGLEALFPSGAPNGPPATPAPDQGQLSETNGKPTLAQPVGRLDRVAIWARRHPAAAALLVLVLVLLGAICGAGHWLRQLEKPRQNEEPIHEGGA